MQKFILATITLAAVLCSMPTNAFTITFDEIPAGSSLYYYNTPVNGVCVPDTFDVVDHSLSTWGPPHSGANVLCWSGDVAVARITFGHATPDWATWYDVQSVGAYFSTQPGVMVRVKANHITPPNKTSLIDTFLIGAPGEAWNNRYVEISSPNGVFNSLVFEGVNSVDDLRGFCLDDLTIIPVPEPSSLAALACGVAGLGGVALRRRGE